MDFDNAKENIQPLASGRNASLLQASLCQDASQELAAQRKQLELDIKNYNGGDPLDAWYTYICWIEQSYPAGGSNSGLQKVMHKCLARFEQDERYKQDPRLIKLFIKFMGNQGDKIECYQEMYNSGIGTMLADFYIAWAYSYDLGGNMRKADEIFRLGIDCRAQPLEELKEAHQHFGYTVAQRMMYTEGEEANLVTQELNDRRLALRSLRGQRQKNTVTVGSVRTGAAVRSNLPGVVQLDGPSTSRAGRNANRQLEVFNDENADVNMPPPPVPSAGGAEATTEAGKSNLRSIIDSAREQENLKEPIAWSKPHKHGKIFGGTVSHDPAFPIHVDEKAAPPITNYERNFDKPFKCPPNFVAKNLPQKPWVTPVTIEDEPDKNALPCYNKAMFYPRPNMEFSPEEYLAYCWFKKRNDQHQFVKRHNEWWGNGASYGVRRYPNFATKSKPQPSDEMDGYRKLPEVPSLKTPMEKLYNDVEQQEYQLEEILAAKWREERKKKHGEMDMEETVLMPDEKVPRRKSFFPSMQPGSSRKSVMPNISKVMEEDEEEENMEEAPTTSKAAGIVVENKFAVPQPPLPQPPPTMSSKFEIHVDDEPPTPARAKATPSAFFDADETCSTQQFNTFLKSQAVSTPKAAQKQAPVRQFGTILKDTSPLPTPPPIAPPSTVPGEEPAELDGMPGTVIATRSVSPMLRKQLSTILETSEHGALGSTGATTKSTLASATSPSESDTLQSAIVDGTPAPSRVHGECTPGPTRLQRQMVNDLSVLSEEPVAGNFERLELWEPNAPSVPMLKSLRFQEDKTETVTRPLMTCYQEDKTETLPKMPLPLPLPDISLHQPAGNASKLFQPALPQLPTEADEIGDSLFCKTPAKPKAFASPMFASGLKRFCNQNTPDMFGKTAPAPQPGKHSLDMFDDVSYSLKADKLTGNKPASGMSKLTDSFMADLSFVPETQPQLETEPQVVLTVMPPPQAAQKKFEIFLDESMPPPPPAAVPAMLDCTVPESEPLPQLTIGPAHLTASFMKDCTELSSCPIPQSLAAPSPQPKFNIFLDETMPPPPSSTAVPEKQETSASAQLTASFGSIKLGNNPSPSMKLKFLNESPDKPEKITSTSEPSTGSDYFELNAATEMFASNLSMIKNSTLLPVADKRSKSPVEIVEVPAVKPEVAVEDDERSIYYKSTPLTPKQSHNSWQETSHTASKETYEHRKANIDETMLNQTLAQQDVNPFSVDIINSLLDSIEFSLYIEKLPSCELQGYVKRLAPQSTLEIKGEKFDVHKIIGKGAYGSIFSGVHKNSGKKVALKQEKPTNYWEYYICLEVQSRLTNEEMITAFMSIDYALVGNNSSIFISDLSEYGSLINICNKYKKHANKNMDEYVVMHLCCQLLDIVDHLHAMGIIHADIKADNFLLTKPLSLQSKQLSVQLIDFGVSIDTKLFPANQTFDYVYNDDALKCIEMRTKRRWTYQLDLFGLAGVMHVLLFGRYMEVVQRQAGGIWMPNQAFPRYFSRQTWDTVFRALINVRDCQSMPNLQDLKTLLKSDLAEKEKYVEAAIAKFNIVMQRQR